METLSSLLNNQGSDDAVVNIVVMVGERDLTYVEEISQKINETFHSHNRYQQLQACIV